MKFPIIALLAAMSGVTPAVAQTPAIQVADAWARATPPNGQSAAVYLTVTDRGAADRITGVSTPVAGMAMMHESSVQGGVSKMRPLADLPLPSQSQVVFRPGGLHIMLEQLARPLKAGDEFPLTLTFAAAPPATVSVKVMKLGASAPAAGDMPSMKMP